MSDTFGEAHSGLTNPGRRHRTITPGADLLNPMPRVLYANTAGTVTVVDELGTSVVSNVTARPILPFRAARITAATASIIAWE